MESADEFSFFTFLLLLPIILSFRPRLSLILQSIISLVFLFLVIYLVIAGYQFYTVFKTTVPYLTFSYSIDSLSLFFLGLVFLLSFATSVYSVGYVEEFKNKGFLTFLYNLFIISIVLVILSSNAITFLVSWETMSLVSFFLVIFDYKNRENLSAGISYAFMTHFGTSFIILAFILLYINSGSLEFRDFASVSLPSSISFFVFISSFIGFGTKAGIFPLHFWLPKAHPVAPSNVSALMSGVMIKTAVYMLIRFYFEFLKDMPASFGYIVLFIGALSALYGILHAYVQTDIKKLLAYSSMENIGIILISLGVSMIFKSYGINLLMGISLVAVLFHTLNHTVFKGLLFLGAGAIVHKTHSKDMEELGGLIKSMPKVAILFLVGILGISALPPFNGFVSEWLIYQSLLFGSKLGHEFLSFSMPIFASVLALTGAFTLGSFAKLYGTVFLGTGRSQKVHKASEPNVFMLMGMGFLSLLVVILGILPFLAIYAIDKVLKELTAYSIYDSIVYKNGILLISTNYDFGRISTVVLLFAGILLFIFIYLLIRVVGSGTIREYETWACGLSGNNLTPKAQYSATGFSQAIRRIFSFVYRTKESLSFEGKKYFLPHKFYRLEVSDGMEFLLRKVSQWVINSIVRIRYYLQPGIIHIYIVYMILTLIILILIAVR